jgi:hypothetical protein
MVLVNTFRSCVTMLAGGIEQLVKGESIVSN